jgi:hypothetical protein
MKLNKDHTQKIILSTLLFVVVLYAYDAFLLGPLETMQTKSKVGDEALAPKLADAKKQIAKTKQLEASWPESELIIKQVDEMVPDGAPVAWFPPLMAEFFKQKGIEKAIARPGREAVGKEMLGFKEIGWSIEIPAAEFVPLAAALSSLENEHPLIEIQSFDIEASREIVQFQHFIVNLNSLSRQ